MFLVQRMLCHAIALPSILPRQEKRLKRMTEWMLLVSSPGGRWGGWLTSPPHAGPEEERAMENPELLALKRELATKAASQELDSYGYYL